MIKNRCIARPSGRSTGWKLLTLLAGVGVAGCGDVKEPKELRRTASSLDAYGTCASCPTDGWSSDPMSLSSIEDHLSAMCCLRHLGEIDPLDGSQGYYAVCDFGAYDWDCAQYGGTQFDGSPGCPGDGNFAQRWIGFFGFDGPPTNANYTGDAMGICGTIQVMGFRYK